MVKSPNQRVMLVSDKLSHSSSYATNNLNPVQKNQSPDLHLYWQYQTSLFANWCVWQSLAPYWQFLYSSHKIVFSFQGNHLIKIETNSVSTHHAGRYSFIVSSWTQHGETNTIKHGRSITLYSTDQICLRPCPFFLSSWVLGTHMHDVGAVIENLHIGLQDVEMEGRGQHTTVAAPLVTGARQETIS